MEVTYWNLSQITEQQLQHWQAALSPERAKRLERAGVKRRRELICGDALARQMLAAYLHVVPEELTFTYNENGKPLCDGAFVSISHSGEALMCAVSECPVGVDIERLRPAGGRLLRVLDEAEQAFVTAADSRRRFAQLWTAKEAWIKCRGGHLGEFRRPALELSEGEIEYRDKEMHLSWPDCPEGYVAAICEKGEQS